MGLCYFATPETRDYCNGRFGLTELPGDRFVQCCKGAAYNPLKASVSVPAANVVTIKKPVLYEGKFVNMVVVVFRTG